MINPIRIAILDLNNGVPNQAMRCFRQLLREANPLADRPLTWEEFDVRAGGQLPDTSFDIYLSTGGPGSPYDGLGQEWERQYFDLIGTLWEHNLTQPDKKHMLFVCHSFQLMCRFFGVARITRRKSMSFGVYPIHKSPEAHTDAVLRLLPEPFYAADFRDWQAVRPDYARLHRLGGTVLALEKLRPHVPFERAVMAIRMSDEFLGVQFHPEADPEGISAHFRKPEKRREIIQRYGADKYRRMMHRLQTPGMIPLTHSLLIPAFLENAAQQITAGPRQQLAADPAA